MLIKPPSLSSFDLNLSRRGPDLSRRGLGLLALGLVAGPARAQSGAGMGLVELFTSQGCSSCPPADALMLKLAQERDFIPLTFAVEIWDYLGWRDTLARPAFTKRQRAYAAMVAGNRVYTPQAIINGRADCVGSDFSTIGKLRQATQSTRGARFEAKANSDGWSVTLAGLPANGPVRLLLVPVADRVNVEITRGENSGRTISYANVARDILDLGLVAGDGRQIVVRRDELAAKKANGFVMIAQSGTPEAPGAVLAVLYADPAGIKA